MPKKTVREMTALEKQHYSLSSRVFHATILGSILLGLVALVIGLGLYTYSSVNHHVSTAFNLTRSAESILRRVVYVKPLADSVMDIYRKLDEGERNEVGTDAYLDRFPDFSEDAQYQTTLAVLDNFLEASDVTDLYLGMYSEEPSALIYIADPRADIGDIGSPGEWESVPEREAEKFLNWDGTGTLYDISRTEKYGWMCTAGVPIRNEKGEPIAYVLADVTLTEVAEGMKSFLIQYVIAMFITMNLYAVLLSLHMKKNLVKPIRAITNAAQDYVRARQAGEATTDHFSMLNIRTGDEIENLSYVMADMERDLTVYMDNLTSITAEKERINTELDLARRIQADMLPNIFPAFPDRKDFDIYASMKPAKEVGGDFYDFFLLDDSHLALVMADVSGKGVPAALFMMISKILVQNYVMSGMSPGKVLEVLNEQICENNREEMFITIWLGVLNLETGILTACSAGHEYPILKDPDGDFKMIKDQHSFVVGGFAGQKYREYTLQMDQGSKLFLYTDGVPEATNIREELFGMERTLRALNDAKEEAPDAIIRRVDRSVEYFVGEASPFDDMTMMCIEYKAKRKGGGSVMKELTVDAVGENLAAVTEFVDAELEALDCPLKTQFKIDVAVDELFTNVAQYAYVPDTGKVTVQFWVEENPTTAVITFIDRGKPFNPMLAKEPDVTLDVKNRAIGGLGIFMVKKSMDEMSYEYKDGQNIVRVKKAL